MNDYYPNRPSLIEQVKEFQVNHVVSTQIWPQIFEFFLNFPQNFCRTSSRVMSTSCPACGRLSWAPTTPRSTTWPPSTAHAVSRCPRTCPPKWTSWRASVNSPSSRCWTCTWKWSPSARSTGRWDTTRQNWCWSASTAMEGLTIASNDSRATATTQARVLAEVEAEWHRQHEDKESISMYKKTLKAKPKYFNPRTRHVTKWIVKIN